MVQILSFLLDALPNAVKVSTRQPANAPSALTPAQPASPASTAPRVVALYVSNLARVGPSALLVTTQTTGPAPNAISLVKPARDLEEISVRPVLLIGGSQLENADQSALRTSSLGRTAVGAVTITAKTVVGQDRSAARPAHPTLH